MKVTPQEFVEIVEERLKAGVPYDLAVSGLQTEGDTPRPRDRTGLHYEILETELRTPATDYTDDGDATVTAEGQEWVEESARTEGRYEAVGWTAPPEDPYVAMEMYVDDVVDRARHARLFDAIRELSKTEQAVINGIFWGGQTQAEVARGLGVARQTVYVLYNRAIAKLREAFDLPPHGESPPRAPRPTQDEMSAQVFDRQRRKGAGLDAKFRRLREAGLV